MDVIFLYNFLIDWILLWSTAYIIKQRPKWHRLALGSSLGAGYTLFIFIPFLSQYYTFVTKFILSVVMVFIVFGYYKLNVFIRRLLLFYLVAFMLGGGLLGIHYILQTEHEIISGIVMTRSGGFGTAVNWIFIVVAFPILWWLSGKGMKQLKEVNQKAEMYVNLTVKIQGETITCRGLIDTGNQLHEPITRIPVTIVDLELFSTILPADLYESVKQLQDYQMKHNFLEMDEVWLQRIRMIPFRSVSRGMNLLVALKPDSVQIEMRDSQYETNKVLVGLNPLPLSSDGSYQAIVHPQLVDHQLLLNKPELSEKPKQAI